jgi:hypothetical protein
MRVDRDPKRFSSKSHREQPVPNFLVSPSDNRQNALRASGREPSVTLGVDVVAGLVTRGAQVLVLVAGLAVSSPSLADDGGASMDGSSKAAAPAADAPADAKSGDLSDDKPAGPANTELLNDFVHYVLIDRPDMAKSTGQALLDRSLSAEEFTKLVDTTVGARRFTQAALRGQRRADLESVSSGLLRSYEGGRLSVARAPRAVEESIRGLTGTLREREYSRAMLVQAGEYAMPQLLPALLDRTNSALSGEVRQVLVEMGRHSVMPLSTALSGLEPADQETAINVLKDIPYTNSVPFIYDVHAMTPSDQTKVAAEAAIRKLTGAFSPEMPISERYAALAADYYAGSPSLVMFPKDTNQLLWTSIPGTGLTFQAIDTQLFSSAMGMQLSEIALKKDPANRNALATWIAGNFQREIRTPEGYENPVYGKDRRDAMYFAVAAGSDPVQTVLARALDASDTPLARRALAALERTGGKTLWGAVEMPGGFQRRALSEALTFPNRRVQTEAAMALAAAGPREAFVGSDLVVRHLASAVRDAGRTYVLVVASDSERQSSLSELFRAQGYTPIQPGLNLAEVRQAVADVPGVDLMVVDLPLESTTGTIESALSDGKLRATPIIAFASPTGLVELGNRFGREARVRLVREGLAPKEVAAAASQLVEQVVGGSLKEEEATGYRARALSLLRDLGVSANPTLRVSDSAGALITAMGDIKDGPTRGRIADVLALVPDKTAQTAIIDSALAASGDDRVRLLLSATESAKRGGNMLDEAQVARIVDLARSGEGPEATAAASLLGALNLAKGEVVPLILDGRRPETGE